MCWFCFDDLLCNNRQCVSKAIKLPIFVFSKLILMFSVDVDEAIHTSLSTSSKHSNNHCVIYHYSVVENGQHKGHKFKYKARAEFVINS